MGSEEADRGSPETPVVFPAVPWLKDGTIYDGFLESSLEHLKAQECDAVEVFPPVLSSTVTDEEYANTSQMKLVTPKLNELVEKFRETDATHILFLNADTEIPSNALHTLLGHDVDVASAISPPHYVVSAKAPPRLAKQWSTVFHWVPPPTPERDWSVPYFRALKMDEVRGFVLGGCEMVGTGHFCMLVRRRVFDHFRFRWNPPRQTIGSELTFWQDAQMLGYKCRIDGRILCGHLPEYPLEELE